MCTGGLLVDCGPEGHQPHSSEVWSFVCDACQRSGKRGESPTARSIDGQRVSRPSCPFLLFGSSDNPTGDVCKHRRSVTAPSPAGPHRVQTPITVFYGYSYQGMRASSSPLILKADAGPWQMAGRRSAIIENGKSGHSAAVGVNMRFGA